MTSRLISIYTSRRRYYHLSSGDCLDTKVDNPDQRIEDDTRAFSRMSVTLIHEFFEQTFQVIGKIVIQYTSCSIPHRQSKSKKHFCVNRFCWSIMVDIASPRIPISRICSKWYICNRYNIWVKINQIKCRTI